MVDFYENVIAYDKESGVYIGLEKEGVCLYGTCNPILGFTNRMVELLIKLDNSQAQLDSTR